MALRYAVLVITGHVVCFISIQHACAEQVTRLLVEAVTVSTANTEREHCFLPSHKGSPFHVHKLAERVLPAELLQVTSQLWRML